MGNDQKVSINFACIKYVGNIMGAVELEEKLFNNIESVREFIYLGDRVSIGGGCEAAVTDRTGCGWVKFRKCD